MVDVLIFLCILLLILALISWVISLLPVPPNVRNALLVVCIVIALLIALQRFGVLAGV